MSHCGPDHRHQRRCLALLGEGFSGYKPHALMGCNEYDEDILSAQLWLKPFRGASASLGEAHIQSVKWSSPDTACFHVPFLSSSPSKAIVLARILTLRSEVVWGLFFFFLPLIEGIHGMFSLQDFSLSLPLFLPPSLPLAHPPHPSPSEIHICWPHPFSGSLWPLPSCTESLCRLLLHAIGLTFHSRSCHS